MYYPNIRDNYKQQYLNSLQLQIANNQKVYNAVILKNLKPILPIRPPDNQTIEEKENDLQQRLLSLQENLQGLTDASTINQIVNDIKNNAELVRFVLQTFPLIKEYIQKFYSAGINYVNFISYVEGQFNKNNNLIIAVQPLLQTQNNQQVMIDEQIRLEQEALNMRILQQQYLDEQELIRLQLLADEKRRLITIENKRQQDAIAEQIRLQEEEQDRIDEAELIRLEFLRKEREAKQAREDAELIAQLIIDEENQKEYEIQQQKIKEKKASDEYDERARQIQQKNDEDAKALSLVLSNKRDDDIKNAKMLARDKFNHPLIKRKPKGLFGSWTKPTKEELQYEQEVLKSELIVVKVQELYDENKEYYDVYLTELKRLEKEQNDAEQKKKEEAETLQRTNAEYQQQLEEKMKENIRADKKKADDKARAEADLKAEADVNNLVERNLKKKMMDKYKKEYDIEKAKRLTELENMRLANAETVQNIKEADVNNLVERNLKKKMMDKYKKEYDIEKAKRLTELENMRLANAETVQNIKEADVNNLVERNLKKKMMDKYVKEYKIEKARRIAQDKKDLEDLERKKKYDEEEIKRLERLAIAEKIKLKSIEDTAKRIADNEETRLKKLKDEEEARTQKLEEMKQQQQDEVDREMIQRIKDLKRKEIDDEEQKKIKLESQENLKKQQDDRREQQDIRFKQTQKREQERDANLQQKLLLLEKMDYNELNDKNNTLRIKNNALITEYNANPTNELGIKIDIITKLRNRIKELLPIKLDEANAQIEKQNETIRMNNKIEDIIESVTGISTYKAFAKNNPILGITGYKDIDKNYYTINQEDIINELKKKVKKTLLEQGVDTEFNKSTTQNEPRKKK